MKKNPISNAYNKNPVSFICLIVSACIFVVAYITSFIPIYYRDYNLFYHLYNFTLTDLTVFFATVLVFIAVFATENEKLKKGLKIIAFSVFGAISLSQFLFDILCEAMSNEVSYLTSAGIFVCISESLLAVACVFLIIAQRLRRSFVANIIGALIALLAFLLEFIGLIINLCQGFSVSSLLGLIYSLAMPAFLLGNVFSENDINQMKIFQKKTPVPAPAEPEYDELTMRLDALKIKFETGTITKEEYESKKAEILTEDVIPKN